MLVFETPKTGLLKVSLDTHNQYAINTATTSAGIHTHTQREGPWMQGMVSCKKKPPFVGPVAFNVGATRRDIQGNIHSVWTMIAHVAMEFRRILLALV